MVYDYPRNSLPCGIESIRVYLTDSGNLYRVLVAGPTRFDDVSKYVRVKPFERNPDKYINQCVSQSLLMSTGGKRVKFNLKPFKI